MSNRVKERHHHGGLHASRFAFWMIALMHDNPLLPIFKNPYRLLKAGGLRPGQKVLEVGCGPGFFTIPAANIVGDEGIVYAVDVHPRAIERVKEKIQKEGVKNVTPILANASNTTLPDQSIDLAFMFGLPHIVDGRENLLSEIHRILKPGGILSYKRTRGSEKKLIEDLEKAGFVYSGRQARILFFTRGQDRNTEG
jgi:ubiquinone/menaquinone biosynthesis C-methylase UbiE